jgi:hypothetical protein
MKNLDKMLVKRGHIQPMEDVPAARELWAEFREAHGAKRKATPLLTAPEANYKFAKTPVPVYGLSLAPDKSSELFQVCPFSTPECRKGCVAYAGQGEAPNVQEGRTRKTEFLAAHPEAFLALLDDEIGRAAIKHGKKGEHIGVRLNAFSDLEWERFAPWLFYNHPDVQFYDYTKHPFGTREDLPNNYHLTWSVSERTSEDEVARILNAGHNVAMILRVPKDHEMPEFYFVRSDSGDDVLARVVDGDASDARYVDVSMGSEKGVVIGLRPKGRMRKGAWNMIKEIQ